MKKILIFKSDRIGDLINISPVIYNLKRNYPNSEITIVCSKYNSKLANYYPEFKDIIIFDKSLVFFSFKYFRKLFLTQYDLLFQLDGKKNSYLCSTFIKSKIKTGLRFIKKKNLFNIFFNVTRPNFLISNFFDYLEPCNEDYENIDNKNYHYLNLYFNILKKIRLTIYSKDHFLPYHDINNLKLNDYLHIHVDERWEKFDNNFFQNFIDKIQNVSDFDNILITSNINGNEFYFKIKNKLESFNRFIFLDNISIKDLLNIIFYSKTVLSSHSGLIVHAAAAFKKNIIDLVPETINNELDRWIPYNINYQRFNINDFSKLFI